jgi:hypothetical protein
MIVYKIRTKDGLFSQGGTWPRFNTKGKIWKRKGDLTSHLNHLPHTKYAEYAQLGAEVVEYDVVERETQTQTLSAYIAEVQNRKALKEQERQQRRAEYLQNERRKQYDELKKEFDNQ